MMNKASSPLQKFMLALLGALIIALGIASCSGGGGSGSSTPPSDPSSDDPTSDTSPDTSPGTGSSSSKPKFGELLQTYSVGYSLKNISSNDSDRIAGSSVDSTGDYLNKIIVWDISNDQIDHSFDGRPFATFNHDGSKIAVAPLYPFDRVTIHSTTTKNYPKEKDVSSSAFVHAMSYKNDGSYFVYAIIRGGQQGLYGVSASAANLAAPDHIAAGIDQPTSIVISNDDNNMAVLAGSEVLLYEPSSDNLRSYYAKSSDQTYDTGFTTAYDVQYSADDSHIAVAGDSGIKIWKTSDNSLVTTLTGHTGDVNAIAYNAFYLVSAGSDNTIKIWDVNNNYTLVTTLTGHSDKVNDLVINSNGELISTSADNTIKRWNLVPPS